MVGHTRLCGSRGEMGVGLGDWMCGHMQGGLGSKGSFGIQNF